ncbi:D-alanine--D-serine ligase VanG [Paenibacillus gansuensis]|uniref:D-alanine--D-alanine ligase n=1 Tax=Paenibacillus gansuensis TaxID=306542 RepID=A0ABW5PKH2_9BACL
MKKLTVGVLFGGRSTEHEVSLSSASAVLDHLDRNKYDVVQIGITREGFWYRYDGNTEGIRSGSWVSESGNIPVLLSPNREYPGLLELTGTEYRYTPLDVVFPVLHGQFGEDGTLQGLLEMSGIPFVGCDMLSSAVGMDKPIAKTLAASAGFKVPPFLMAVQGTSIEELTASAEALGYPLYVKPARSGSSIGISKVYNRDDLLSGIREAWNHDSRIIIESHVEGVEIGCAVMGNSELVTGEIDEVALAGEFFDHTEKYSLATAAIHLPARLDAAQAAQAKDIAIRIYRLLGCSGLSRVDLFLSPEGDFYFNEVNTIPGFTATSRYPNMMRAAGIEFPELLDLLVKTAMVRGR